MTASVEYPTFSEAEHDRRRPRQGDDVGRGSRRPSRLRLVGDGEGRPGRRHYLSGYLGMRDNYVVLGLEADPVLFAQSYNHVPNAAQVSAVEARWGGVDSGATVAEGLQGRGELGWRRRDDAVSALRLDARGAAWRSVQGCDPGFSDPARHEERRGAGVVAPRGRFHRPAARRGDQHAYLADGGLTGFYYLATTPMAAPERCVPPRCSPIGSSPPATS